MLLIVNSELKTVFGLYFFDILHTRGAIETTVSLNVIKFATSCRVLLRVRLLYYLKQEVIGAEEEKVFLGKHFSEIDIPPPSLDGEVPCGWWDEDADKSLLIGTHKHGK